MSFATLCHSFGLWYPKHLFSKTTSKIFKGSSLFSSYFLIFVELWVSAKLRWEPSIGYRVENDYCILPKLLTSDQTDTSQQEFATRMLPPPPSKLNDSAKICKASLYFSTSLTRHLQWNCECPLSSQHPFKRKSVTISKLCKAPRLRDFLFSLDALKHVFSIPRYVSNSITCHWN